MARPQGRNGTLDRGIPHLMVQARGSDVSVVSMGHKGDAEDVGVMTGSKHRALAKRGDIPETESTVIRGGDEGGGVVG